MPVFSGSSAPSGDRPGPFELPDLFGIGKIPGDSQIRAKLDAVDPAMFHPVFADMWPNWISVAVWTPCAAWTGIC
jgi:hypothetical protein